VNLLVWGGGGVLLPFHPKLHERLFPGVAEQLERMLRMAQRRAVRVCAVSVGGDGSEVVESSPPYRETLIRLAEYVSVRTPADQERLRRRGVASDCFPDIVWQTPRLVGSEAAHRRIPGTGRRLRVGIDVYFSNLARQGALHLLPLLAVLIRARRDIEFVLMDSTNRAMRPPHRLVGVMKGPNVQVKQFCDLASDLTLLRSLDVLMTSRLHTMVAAMSFGVPSVSLCGEKKTKLMLDTLDRRDLYFGRRRAALFLTSMSRQGALHRFVEGYDPPDVERLARESDGHVRALLRFASTPARPEGPLIGP
jgi:polysaccharide pyruvyl transferase WcaK-like protein